MPLLRPFRKVFGPNGPGEGRLAGRRGAGSPRNRAIFHSFSLIPEHRRQAEALRAIVKATAGSGKDFFQGLVAELAKVLGVKYAFIGELLPGAPERVRTVAVWSNGAQTGAFEYELEGTPCANVVGKSLCLYPRGVRQQFPRDTLLTELGAESYVGIPLFGTRGAALGLLCVLDDRPMRNSDLAKSLMTVFASRAAAELERQRAQEALQASEARYRMLYQAMMDAFGTVDMNGRILDCNEPFAHMLGYRPEEIQGLTYRDITPEKWHAFEAEIVEPQVLHRGYSDVYEKEYRRKDGTVFPVELRVILLKNEAGTPCGMWAIVRDITERKRAEGLQAGERRVLEMIARRLPLAEVLNEVCRFVDELSPEAFSSILLLERDSQRLWPTAGPKLPESWNRAITPLPIGPGMGSCGSAAFGKKRVIVSDIATDPLWTGHTELTELALKSGLRACWSTPILSADEQVLGTFALYYPQPRSPRPADLHLIDHVTHLARVAIEHHRAVGALLESEARYRALHQANPTMIFTLDAQGTILSVNPFAARQLGYTREELEGQPVLNIFYPEDRLAVSEQLQRCLLNPHQSCTWQFRKVRKDGALLWVEEIAQALTRSNGELSVLVVCQDITERKQAELELQKLAAVVQNSSDFIGICTPDMEPLFLNEAGRRMVGLDSMEEVLQTGILDYFWPEDRPFIESQAIPTLVREGRWSGEVRFRHFKTGEPIYTIWNTFIIRDAEGRPMAWATNSPNLTRMKQAELALRESEARFAKAFHSNPSIVTITRLSDGRFIDVNESFLRLFGFERTEVIGQTALGLNLYLNPQERPALMEKLQRAQSVRGYETRARTKDGTVLDLLVYLERIELASEPCVLSTAFDITERKQAEEALRRAHDDLEQRVRERTAELVAANQHLEELDRLKSQFLATMSHELRTPLNSIVGFVGILRQGFAGPVNAEQKKQLDMAYGSARHLLSLINDLLDLSRIEAGKVELEKQPFDFGKVVTEVLDTLGPLARQKHLSLVSELPTSPLELVGDRKRCLQVLLNLANNAVKFTEQGEVRISVHVEPGRLQVSVSDTGIGIKPEQIGMLFEAFRQLDSSAKRVYEGTGLGLHLCRRLLSLMGGEIDVASAFGKGSRFSFSLPCAPPSGASKPTEGSHESADCR